MASLINITKAVELEKTVEQSVLTLVRSLTAELSATAQRGEAAVAALLKNIEQHAVAFADAVTHNTPQPPVAPTTDGPADPTLPDVDDDDPVDPPPEAPPRSWFGLGPHPKKLP